MQEQELKYQQILNAASEAILILDKDTGKILEANEAVKSIFGYNPKKLIGMYFNDLSASSMIDSDQNIDYWIQEASKETTQVFNWYSKRKSGELFDSEVTLRVAEIGEKEHILAVIRDITDRKKAENEIQFRLNFEQLIAEISTRYINLHTEEIYTEFEASLKQISSVTGCDRSYVLQLSEDHSELSCVAEWHWDRLKDMKSKMQNISTDKLPWWTKKIKRCKVQSISNIDKIPETEEYMIEILKTAMIQSGLEVPIQHGKKLIGVLGLASSSKDIVWPDEQIVLLKIVSQIFANAMERQKLDADLLANEEKYRLLFESTNDAIFIMKCDKIIDCNAQTLKIFGCKKDQIIGRTPHDFSPLKQPDNRNSKEKALEKIYKTEAGEHQIFEWKHTKHDETPFDAEVSLNPLFLKGVTYIQAILRDITERKHAEQAILESENRLRRLSESTFEGIAFTDKGKVIDVNQQMATVLGYTRDEMIGMEVMKFVAPSSHKIVIDNIKTAIEEDYEHEAIRKDGSIFHVEARGRSIMLDGRSIRVTAIRDVTERKEAEKAIRESEKKLRDIINSSPDAITVTDGEGIITQCNEATCALHGYGSVDELIGMNVLQLISKRDHQRAIENTNQTFTMGSIRNVEYDLVRKDGSEFPGELSASIRKDDAGNPVAFIGITKDITERKMMELALQEEKQFLNGIIEGLPGDFFIIDETGSIMRWNKNREKILGYTAEELKGKSSMAHIIPEDQKRIGKELSRVFQGESVQAEYSIITKAGEIIPFLANGTQVTVNEKKYVIGLAIDISDIKATEAALRESEEHNRLLIENLPSVIWATDEDGKTTYISPNVKNVYGYTPEEIYENGEELFFNRIHKDDVIHVQKAFNQLFMNNKKYEVEYRIQRKDGKWIWLIDRASTTRKIGGKSVAFGVFSDITERKRAIEEMEKLAAVIRHSSELVNLGTLEGKMIFLNEAGGRMLGIDPEEVEQTHIMEVIPEHLVDLVEKEMLPTLMSGGIWEGDLQYRNLKTGELTDVHSTTFTVKDSDTDKPLYLANVSLDITERKKAEIALQQSEEKYRLVVENANEAILVVQNSKIMFYNQKTIELLDYTKNDIENSSIEKFLYPDDTTKVVEHRQRRQNGDDLPLINEIRIIDKKGQMKWVYNNSIVFEWEGQPATLHFISDITDRRMAEEALRNSEERFRSVVEQSSDGIILTDEKGIIIVWNKGEESMTAIKRSDAIHKPIWEILAQLSLIEQQHQFSLRELKTVYLDVCNTGKATWFNEVRELEIVSADQKHKVIQIIVNPIKTSKGYRISSTSRDVTELKAVEKQLKVLSSVVEQSTSSINVLNKDQIVEYANPKYLELYHYDSEMIIGKHWNTYVPKDSPLLAKFSEIQEVVVSKGVEWRGTIQVPSPSEQIIWRDVIIFPIKDHEGNTTHTVYMSNDITDRVMTQMALKESEAKYRHLVELATDGILILQDGKILFANNRVPLFLGISLPKLLGTDFTNYIDEQDRARIADMHIRRLKGEEFQQIYETKCIVKGRGTVDIEINRLNQDKEVLSTEMKFRINTNLQIICSLLRLQSNRIKDPHSKRIIDSAYQRIHTIDMIQDRIYHLDNPSHINLAEFIQSYVRSLYYVYQIHENDITIDSDCKPVCVVADSAIYWGLIVHELISNAVEHPFQNTKQKNNKIKIALKRLENNQVQLSVKDNGKGLPKKFDLHSLESMGLNLVISIAEHHLKGLVSIQKNKGTCFTVAANG
ncbi:PAS domain S-box protein [candidate division KSB1 bacterium]|nr:PAS domain S-box protein [candidate division KSB1 bacterium]